LSAKAPVINLVPASASPQHLLSETVDKAYEPRLPPLLLSNTVGPWSERHCCPGGAAAFSYGDDGQRTHLQWLQLSQEKQRTLSGNEL